MNDHKLFKPHALYLFCALSALAAPAWATLSVSGSARSFTDTQFLSDSFDETSDTAASLYASIPLDYKGGQAGASINYGAVRVGAIGNLFSDVINQSLFVIGGLGNASAHMSDTLTIKPSLGFVPATSTGMLSIPINAFGFAKAVVASANADDGPDITYGSAIASYNVKVTSHALTIKGSGGTAQGAPEDQPPPIEFVGPILLTAPFTFGVPFDLELSAQAITEGYAQSSGGIVKLHGSLENTIQLMGISEITDAIGNPIALSQLEISALSGTDYRMAASLPDPLTIAPIPLPASVALLTLPIGLILRKYRTTG